MGVPAEGTFSKLNQPKERGKNQVIAPAYALFLRVILEVLRAPRDLCTVTFVCRQTCNRRSTLLGAASVCGMWKTSDGF